MSALERDYSDWMQAAFDVEAENRELRRLITNLIVWIAKQEHISREIRGAIGEWWPEKTTTRKAA